MKYYLDCEFDGFGGELISMGIVSQNYLVNKVGNNYTEYKLTYLVNEKYLDINNIKSDWVKNNVFPHINTKIIKYIPYTKETLPLYIKQYFGEDNDIEIFVDWPDDIKYFCESIITGPGSMISLNNIKFNMIRVNSYPSKDKGLVQHNAICDAIALKIKLSRNEKW